MVAQLAMMHVTNTWDPVVVGFSVFFSLYTLNPKPYTLHPKP